MSKKVLLWLVFPAFFLCLFLGIYLHDAYHNSYLLIPSEQSEVITTEEPAEQKKININTADKSELMELEGIGEARAKEIIRYREKRGGFKSIQEIMHISGIGRKSFLKLRDYITVTEE